MDHGLETDEAVCEEIECAWFRALDFMPGFCRRRDGASHGGDSTL
jgi:hypothetical protein